MAPFPVQWLPGDFTYREPAEAALREVARRLGLSTRLRTVRVRVLPRPAMDHARVAWIEAPRLTVRIDSDLGNFLTPGGRAAQGGRRRGETLLRRHFSLRAARATFLHELSHVRDSLAYGIDSSALPARRWASFNEAWNVWIDGRLARRGLPSLSRRERWREFRHTFRTTARAHARTRRVFDRLWRAEKLSQRDLLEAVEILVG
jgi:hypothetical protein